MKPFRGIPLKHNPLFRTFSLPITVDVIGTVLGQPPAYWTSNYQVFSEALPIYPLLQLHPLVFITVCLGVWLPFTYWLVLKLKHPFNLWAAMALFVGHGYNSITWLRIDMVRAGWIEQNQVSQALGLIPVILYVLLISWLATTGFLHTYKQKANL